MVLVYGVIGFYIMFYAMRKTEEKIIAMGVDIDELEEYIYE